jgi:hypothetical protein
MLVARVRQLVFYVERIVSNVADTPKVSAAPLAARLRRRDRSKAE